MAHTEVHFLILLFLVGLGPFNVAAPSCLQLNISVTTLQQRFASEEKTRIRSTYSDKHVRNGTLSDELCR
jgi:hypothetical protein